LDNILPTTPRQICMPTIYTYQSSTLSIPLWPSGLTASAALPPRRKAFSPTFEHSSRLDATAPTFPAEEWYFGSKDGVFCAKPSVPTVTKATMTVKMTAQNIPILRQDFEGRWALRLSFHSIPAESRERRVLMFPKRTLHIRVLSKNGRFRA
jgi:hypothetical protein